MLVGSTMLFSAFMEGEIATSKSKLMAHMLSVGSDWPIVYDIIQDAEAELFINSAPSHNKSHPWLIHF